MEAAVCVLFRLVDGRLARGLISIAVLVVLCAVAGSASASFPGRNGKLVYGWSSGGLYRGAPSATSIRTVDPRSGSVRVLRDCPRTAGDPGHPDCSVSAPRYSPDGQRIAFSTVRQVPTEPPYFGAISIMASNGTGLVDHPTPNAFANYALAWSPAGDGLLGQRSVVSCCDRGGIPIDHGVSIFHVSLDGTELSEVASQTMLGIDWSSRGEIAFSSQGQCPPTHCYDLYVTRLGGTPRRLTYRGGLMPSWSPNGRKLAFLRDRDIYLVRRDGTGLRRLTFRGGVSPAWSPDGKWIAFIRDGDLYVVRTNGRERRRLVNPPGDGSEGSPILSLGWQALPRR
jgi:Tol biopolymer transport system component